MTWKNWIGIAASALVLSGCGGGGGGAPEPNKVTVETDAIGAAYYDRETATWKKFDGKEENIGGEMFRYTLDLQGDYDIALSCTTNGKKVYLFSLNQKSDNYIRVGCTSEGLGRVDLSGNITNNTSETASGYVVAVNREWNIFVNNPYELNASTGLNDLVAVMFVSDGNNNVPKRFWIERDLEFDPVGDTYNIDFTNDNSYLIESHGFTNVNGTKGWLGLITPNGTYFTSVLGDRWYYPQGGLSKEDTYVMVAEDDTKNTKRIDAYRATKMPRKDLTAEAGYIESLDGYIHYNTTGDGAAELDGMSLYVPATAASEKLRGFLFYLRDDTNDREYYIMASKDRVVNGLQTPDLSAVEGFATAWRGNNADEVYATAVMSNVSFSTMMRTGRMLHLKKLDTFLVPGATIELAEDKVK